MGGLLESRSLPPLGLPTTGSSRRIRHEVLYQRISAAQKFRCSRRRSGRRHQQALQSALRQTPFHHKNTSGFHKRVIISVGWILHFSKGILFFDRQEPKRVKWV